MQWINLFKCKYPMSALLILVLRKCYKKFMSVLSEKKNHLFIENVMYKNEEKISSSLK
jgi:hypothetical protein